MLESKPLELSDDRKIVGFWRILYTLAIIGISGIWASGDTSVKSAVQ
jgi:hypothetical protein